MNAVSVTDWLGLQCNVILTEIAG